MAKNGGEDFRTPQVVARAALLALVLALAPAACEKPLPEVGSASEQLYAAKCGSCHRAYNPHSLTAPMWQVQMDSMHVKISAAGERAPTPQGQKTILAHFHS